MDYDLKIAGGTLYDGEGSPGQRGDLGIRDGRVVAMGEAPGSAARTLAADGRAVAPGFVDIHTHYDAQILWDRMLTISPWHGVTTVVMGNCGFGIAPTRAEHRELILKTLEKVEGMSLDALQAGLGDDWPFETFPEYLDAIEKSGSVINVGALIGHTPLRLYVMGEEATERAATHEEIARMRALVKQGLDAGAVGFATSKSPTHVGYGGRPVPSRLAETSEIQEIARALGDAGRGVMQATVGSGLFFQEFADIARENGRPVSWTALLAGMGGPGSHRGFLDRSAKIREEGIPVYPQVACRPLNFEFTLAEPFLFESMSLFKPVSASDREGKKRVYRDPEFRRAFKEKAGPGTRQTFGTAWDLTIISYCESDKSLEERKLVDVAEERGTNPIDLMLDLSLENDLAARFRMGVLNTNEDEVAELLTSPHTILGLSDAGAHASQLCDACFSTHLLSRWVREKQLLTLEQAIHKLTAQAADVFGLHDRGRLKQGAPADVVVFDPETIGASGLRRVHDMPAGADRLLADAYGIDAVVVNGTIVREQDRDLVDPQGPLPGTVVRG